MNDSIITIEASHLFDGETSIKKYPINLNNISFFNIHWRNDDWHIEVFENKGINYELGDFVTAYQVAKIITNENSKVKQFFNNDKNYHFIENMFKVFYWAKQIIYEKNRIIPKMKN
jgi:hypothetical protein